MPLSPISRTCSIAWRPASSRRLRQHQTENRSFCHAVQFNRTTCPVIRNALLQRGCPSSIENRGNAHRCASVIASGEWPRRKTRPQWRSLAWAARPDPRRTCRVGAQASRGAVGEVAKRKVKSSMRTEGMSKQLIALIAIGAAALGWTIGNGNRAGDRPQVGRYSITEEGGATRIFDTATGNVTLFGHSGTDSGVAIHYGPSQDTWYLASVKIVSTDKIIGDVQKTINDAIKDAQKQKSEK